MAKVELDLSTASEITHSVARISYRNTANREEKAYLLSLALSIPGGDHQYETDSRPARTDHLILDSCTL